MLQCQNYMLADQVSTLKSVAKKVAMQSLHKLNIEIGTARLTKEFIRQ